MDGWIDRWMCEDGMMMDGWIIDVWGWIDEDGWMMMNNGWMDGWMDGGWISG